MNLLVVTGTGTEVGKTIVTAAIAALAHAAGKSVTVVKAAQTGVAPLEEGDVDVIRRLSGITEVREVARYPEPLAPATAARRSGMAAVTTRDVVDVVAARAGDDVVLVEGAGGLLVHLNDRGETLADVACELAAPILVVSTAGLGTLNAVALTCEALRARDLHCVGIVIGSWPAAPDLATACNLDDVSAYGGAPLLGVLPAGAGDLTPADFLEVAGRGLSPVFGGTFAITAFAARHATQ